MNNEYIINDYSKLIYNSGPVKIMDYIEDRYNKLHDILFNEAFDKYIKENFPDKDKSEVLKDYKFVEIKNEEFFLPPKLKKIKKNINNTYKPGEKTVEEIDLGEKIKKDGKLEYKYWNKYQENKNMEDFFKYIHIDEETRNTSEIIYIDFYRGKIKMRSKLTDNEFEIDFNNYNSDLKVSENFHKISKYY